MNLLKATVAKSMLAFVGGQYELPVPAAFAGLLRDGQQVIVGIRPESFRIENDTGLLLKARCEVAELTGPELIVTANAGGQRVLASLPPRFRFSEGEMLDLCFDEAALHLFDASSGQRIASPGT
jgi:multiple sugar transport system ATP-binding protein